MEDFPASAVLSCEAPDSKGFRGRLLPAFLVALLVFSCGTAMGQESRQRFEIPVGTAEFTLNLLAQ